MPLTAGYERRISDLTAEVARLEAALATESRKGLWVPPGHFYSPIPNPDDVRRREPEIYGRSPLDVPAVQLNADAQWALLDVLEPLIRDLDFAATQSEARARGQRYWYDNPAFGSGDASFLTSMLRHFKPSRLVELGSGYSSACTLDARDRYLEALDITFVDPYTELLESVLLPGDRDAVKIMAVGSEQVDPEVFAALEAGDILFIDSTHVARTGSDVNQIFFRILPSLRPGVIVHLHDIFPHFEYPQPWVYEGRGWTEQYVLRAFLQYNQAFEILLWPVFLLSLETAGMLQRFPAMTRNWGGSFWFRKTA